jgi:ubiquinone/menaquinone biosynthesis C-methylase UbiE
MTEPAQQPSTFRREIADPSKSALSETTPSEPVVSDSRSPAAAYERFTLEFFRRWGPYYDLFAGSIAWAYSSLVRSLSIEPGMSILDICVGTGEVALRCASRGARVTGIDLSPDMLARARRKAGARGLDVDLLRADARWLPFDTSAFEVVTISFALHDMPRKVRGEVLAEATRVGRSRLAILDYDLPRPSLARTVTHRLIDLFESPFFSGFVKQGLGELLREEGLPVASVRRDPSRLFSVYQVPLSGWRVDCALRPGPGLR